MKNFIICVAILFSSFCGPVWASEGNDEVTAATARLAEAKTAAAKKQAEAAAAKAAIESIRRSQRTYSEFAVENVRSAGNTALAAAYVTAGTAIEIEGYTGTLVAVPADWLTKKAFDGGDYLWSAAEAAWNAPVASQK